MKNTRMNSVQISTNFIDLNYADDLHENLKDYPDVNIISGKYEDTIVDLLSDKNSCNVFYIINMNSFGFVREACHAFGIHIKMFLFLMIL
jgi:hypothetical protein